MIARMEQRLDAARAKGQRREVFLYAYRFLSERLRVNLVGGRFVDGHWTIQLALRFAELYFEAEAAYDRGEACSQPWARFFRATEQRWATNAELLLLGMNAHIVYDLPIALADGLRPHDSAALALHQFDHEMVNEILDEAIDPFQEAFARHYATWLFVADRLAWRLDEWLIDRVLRELRHDVWKHATAMAAAPDAPTREIVRRHLEDLAVGNVRKIDALALLPQPLRRLAHRMRAPL